MNTVYFMYILEAILSISDSCKMAALYLHISPVIFAPLKFSY